MPEKTRVKTLWGNTGIILSVKGQMAKVLLDMHANDNRAAWYYLSELSPLS